MAEKVAMRKNKQISASSKESLSHNWVCEYGTLSDPRYTVAFHFFRPIFCIHIDIYWYIISYDTWSFYSTHLSGSLYFFAHPTAPISKHSFCFSSRNIRPFEKKQPGALCVSDHLSGTADSAWDGDGNRGSWLSFLQPNLTMEDENLYQVILLVTFLVWLSEPFRGCLWPPTKIPRWEE